MRQYIKKIIYVNYKYFIIKKLSSIFHNFEKNYFKYKLKYIHIVKSLIILLKTQNI
jgi:hypothetical protein